MTVLPSIKSGTVICPYATKRANEAATLPASTASPSLTSHGTELMKMSSWSKAVSGAVQRAEARDISASINELRALADRAYRRVFEGNWRDGWEKLAAEIPDNADPERVAFSKKVTAFMDRRTTLSDPQRINLENPFLGLDMHALSAIKYDESGAFTTNERRAAALERSRQYREWSIQTHINSKAERQQTGSRMQTNAETLAYYESCPPIERAQFPDGYLDLLRSRSLPSARTDCSTDDTPPMMLSLLMRWMLIATGINDIGDGYAIHQTNGLTALHS